MNWQRLALVAVAVGMVLVLFAKGRYKGDQSLVSAFYVPSQPSAWLQLAGDVRYPGAYPLDVIKMTNDVINVAEPLCVIQYDQLMLERLLEQQGGASLTIACQPDNASGLVLISPLLPQQHLVLLGSIALNTATADELCLVPGIGPVMAQRLIDHRQKSGGFKRFEDLLLIKGIGYKKLEVLKKYLTI